MSPQLSFLSAPLNKRSLRAKFTGAEKEKKKVLFLITYRLIQGKKANLKRNNTKTWVFFFHLILSQTFNSRQVAFTIWLLGLLPIDSLKNVLLRKRIILLFFPHGKFLNVIFSNNFSLPKRNYCFLSRTNLNIIWIFIVTSYYFARVKKDWYVKAQPAQQSIRTFLWLSNLRITH